MNNATQCPKCGYPDTKDGQHFKGIYTSGMPCPHCQFFQGREPLESLSTQAGPYPTAWANYAMKDLGLHVRIRMQNSAVMAYEVREYKHYDDGAGDTHKFEMSVENGAVEYTSDIEKSDVLIEGSIKWDGCSHNNFAPNEPNRGYIHGCAREDLIRLGDLYRRLFDFAIERMPDSKEYLT